MTTNRDELARVIADALADADDEMRGHGYTDVANPASATLDSNYDLTQVADAVLAAGWRNVGEDADIHTATQWGYKQPGGQVVWTPCKASAEDRAAHIDGAEVVSRTVTTIACTSGEK